MQKEESIKKSLKKRALVFFVIIFLCIPLFSSQIAKFRLSNYKTESIPYADNFLKLLIDRKYEEVYNKYAIDSGMEIGDLERQAEKIDSEFGVIKSFSYKRMSFSKDGMFGDLIGFFLYYTLEFDNEKSYTGTFSIDIDRETNKPIIGRMFNFKITGDYGEKYLEIRLISRH